MVAVKSWDRFQQETISLYESNPTKTRYSVKFRAIDGKLTLKITDDVHTFKHSTSSSITLNRFTALNTLLFEKMAATSLAPPPSPAPALIAGGDAAGITATGGLTTAGAEAMEGIESGPPAAPTGGSAPGTGAKKKKKGKGKK